jgi:hypothetical protein
MASRSTVLCSIAALGAVALLGGCYSDDAAGRDAKVRANLTPETEPDYVIFSYPFRGRTIESHVGRIGGPQTVTLAGIAEETVLRADRTSDAPRSQSRPRWHWPAPKKLIQFL